MRRMPIPSRQDPLADPFAKRFSLDGREIWDPITGETELVSRFVWPGFRGAFTEYLELTAGMAVALKELEVGLRDAGLVTATQELVQSAGSPGKFRVKELRVSDDAHGSVSFGKSGDPAPAGSQAALTEVPKRLRRRRGPVKGEERERPLTGMPAVPAPAGPQFDPLVPLKLRRRRGDLI